jgi:hypothetical protein
MRIDVICIKLSFFTQVDGMTMNKREFLRWVGGAGLVSLAPLSGLAQTQPAGVSPADTATTLAAAWRQGTGAGSDFVGLLQLDWAQAQSRIKAAVALPSRSHGLVAQADGGFVAVAVRPGSWIVRCDAQGHAAQWLQMDSEPEGRTLDGHVCASADGQWLYTTETNTRSGQGWISVRDARSLHKVAQWRTHGVEPHQALLDATGSLWVANGGIYRADGDKKRDLHLMDSSLVRINLENGERLGQWRLKDQRLGIRHMAWSAPNSAGEVLLGIALQNEHDDIAQRRSSPVLAVWDGKSLQTPALAPVGGGYSGDIVAGPQGGFVLSCMRANAALQWSPANPAELSTVAMLQEVGALAPWVSDVHPQGVLMAAARGVGRWHPQVPAAMLKWPEGLVVDNHWVVV